MSKKTIVMKIKDLLGVCLVWSLFVTPSNAGAQGVWEDPNTLIIPMDTTYQDNGIFLAYGLVYKLLQNGIPIDWCILNPKDYGETDFTISEIQDQPFGGNTLYNVAYRGGPFVVPAAYYTQALGIVTGWQSSYPQVAVHRAAVSFQCPRARELLTAPTIALFVDGKEEIAFKYLNAAAIPDSLGQAWPTQKDNSGQYPGYPDLLNVSEVEGPTTTNHKDGALFDATGYPKYCQFMSMHYKDSGHSAEVVAEVNEFLQYKTHFFAECQAVNAFENDPNGLFLTTAGLTSDVEPDQVFYFNQGDPFTQADGPYENPGGSEPSYTLPNGSLYYDLNSVMVNGSGTQGTMDIWMNGRWRNQPDKGKVSYLGGHKYDVALPLSANPKSQGTRYFLNSLFEAPCATSEAAPVIVVTKTGPSITTSDTWTYTLTLQNTGNWPAQSVFLYDTLPSGLNFISADGGGTWDGVKVTWNVGTVHPNETLTFHVSVQATQAGTYTNQASTTYNQGLTERSTTSNSISTNYGIYDIYRDVSPVLVVQPPNMKDVTSGNFWDDPENVLQNPQNYFYKVAIQGVDNPTPVIFVQKLRSSNTVRLTW